MSRSGFPADWPAPAGIRTWQTIRAGGVSRGTYASFNLGRHVGDRTDAVAANRERLIRDARLPGEPHWLEQVHGTRILNLDLIEAGPADGAVTARPDTVLAVLTADCLPVLLARIDGARIGVAHAGWRGMAGGVLESAISAFDCAPAELMAWLGPAIGQDAFEVGEEVRTAFVTQDPAVEHAFLPNARGRWQADLRALAKACLARAGVAQIYGRAGCTFADSARFFSHRREAPCGRMASLIWRES